MKKKAIKEIKIKLKEQNINRNQIIYSENNNLMSDEGSKEEEFFLEKDININTNSIINENDNEILNYI